MIQRLKFRALDPKAISDLSHRPPGRADRPCGTEESKLYKILAGARGFRGEGLRRGAKKPKLWIL